MFALFHGNINQAAYAFSIGAFFAFVYIRTGRVRYTAILHICINCMGSLVGGSVIKLLDMEKFSEIMASQNTEAIVSFVTDNIKGLAIFGVYFIFVISLLITGIVVLCVNLKKFKLNAIEGEIPKGERFNTVVFNVGMLICIIAGIVMCIYQALA